MEAFDPAQCSPSLQAMPPRRSEVTRCENKRLWYSRSRHRTFVELAIQSKSWKLSAKDLRQLSKMSVRPKA